MNAAADKPEQPITIGGRVPKVMPSFSRWFIFNYSGHQYLWHDGKWHKDTGHGEGYWPTREAAEAFAAEHADKPAATLVDVTLPVESQDAPPAVSDRVGEYHMASGAIQAIAKEICDRFYQETAAKCYEYSVCNPSDLDILESLASEILSRHFPADHQAVKADALPAPGEHKHTAWQPHRYEQSGSCGCESCTKMKLERLLAENSRLRSGLSTQQNEIQQVLGKALKALRENG